MIYTKLNRKTGKTTAAILIAVAHAYNCPEVETPVQDENGVIFKLKRL